MMRYLVRSDDVPAPTRRRQQLMIHSVWVRASLHAASSEVDRWRFGGGGIGIAGGMGRRVARTGMPDGGRSSGRVSSGRGCVDPSSSVASSGAAAPHAPETKEVAAAVDVNVAVEASEAAEAHREGGCISVDRAGDAGNDDTPPTLTLLAPVGLSRWLSETLSPSCTGGGGAAIRAPFCAASASATVGGIDGAIVALAGRRVDALRPCAAGG